MRKITAFMLIFVLVFQLAGCSLLGMEEDQYRTDTVIYIPADPTTEATEPVAEPEETEPEKTETKASTSKPATSTSSSKKNNTTSKNPTTSTVATSPATEATTEPVTEATTEATTLPTETENQLYDISGYVVGVLETAMMDQVNSHRREVGLGELSKNTRLCAIASARAYEACLSWSHTRPDGRSYTTVVEDYDFSCSTLGENLLYTSGGEDGATLVSKWMGADSNRDNLMYQGFTTIGIGIYEANGYVFIACLLAG